VRPSRASIRIRADRPKRTHPAADPPGRMEGADHVRTRQTDLVMEGLSFEAFYGAESQTLFRRLWLISGNRSEAEEIMQDAFLRLLERWDRIDQLKDPTAYLYRTAMNVFRGRYRRSALAMRRTFAPDTARDEFAEADARDAVRRALATLSPRQRAALVLTELEGMSSREAGDALGITASTVRALATQGRIAFRTLLEGTDA
jgi:RNA polymerase sigma factor (sigma-70 family)